MLANRRTFWIDEKAKKYPGAVGMAPGTGWPGYLSSFFSSSSALAIPFSVNTKVCGMVICGLSAKYSFSRSLSRSESFLWPGKGWNLSNDFVRGRIV